MEVRGKSGRLKVDISPFEDLKEDLAKRDFTINALAWRVKEFLRGKRSIVDPFGGMEDLRKKRIRVVSEVVFQKDAVRILRAIRQATELGFEIEPQTELLIRRDASLLPLFPVERRRREVLKIF